MDIFRTIQHRMQPNNNDMIKLYLEKINIPNDIKTNIESINEDIRDHYLSKIIHDYDFRFKSNDEYTRIKNKLNTKSNHQIYYSDFVLTLAQTIIQLNDKIDKQQQIINKYETISNLDNKSNHQLYDSDFIFNITQTIIQLNDKINKHHEKQQQIVKTLVHLIDEHK